jgi:hypothetical protein
LLRLGALILIPPKLPLLFGYSHHAGEPPALHAKNPTSRPPPLSFRKAAEMSL